MRVDAPLQDNLDARGLRIAVITSTFNESITGGLQDGAVTWLETANAEEILVAAAPGAFELPLFAQHCVSLGYDAVVCLGAVIEGETDHYTHVATQASEGLMRVQLDTGVPVAFGVLTVTEVAHAIARSRPDEHNKGREAAIAAVAAVRALASLSAASGE